MESNNFKELHGITSRYAQTLNSLCSMQGSLVYASRRMVLIDAEMAITSLEAQCEQLIAQRDELLETLKMAKTELEWWVSEHACCDGHETGCMKSIDEAIANCEVKS